MEFTKRDLHRNPRQSANWILLLTFGWTIPIFRRTSDKSFDSNDAFEPLEYDRSAALGDRLERNWNVERENKSKPSLARAVARTFWFEILVAGVLCFLNFAVLRFTFPFLLGNFLEHFRENSDESQNALISGTVIVVTVIALGVSGTHYYYFGSYYGLKVRVAVCNLIYRKVLVLSQKSLREAIFGKLTNLLANDLNRFNFVFGNMHPLWISPLFLVGSGYILCLEIQWAAVFSLGLFFVFASIQSYCAKLSTKISSKSASLRDERVRLMNEVVSGVQVIKMCSWEEPFTRIIGAARQIEMKSILNRGYAISVQMINIHIITRLAVFAAVVGTIHLNGRESLSVSKLFVLFNMLTFISFLMGSFVRSVSAVGEALVALKRLQKFLESHEKEEVDEDSSEHISANELEPNNLAILMRMASAQWTNGSDTDTSNKTKESNGKQNGETEKLTEAKPFMLKEIDVSIHKGKLVFLTGSVGAGKSTLMQVLLRELPLVHGAIGISGSISYASQESWVFNSTIQQNITFGQPMDRSRYDEVVRCTALKKDFEQLNDGDMTLVGENGVGLSGGQRARVNLARAVYRDADIYLIDDPLSAVDAHVQSHIFNECIGPNGILARQNATRILITHQLYFSKDADWIIVLRDGGVEIQGTYDDILESGVDFNRLSSVDDENNGESEVTEANVTERLSFVGNIASVTTEKQTHNPNQDKENKTEKLLEESSKGKGSLVVHYFKSANRPFSVISLIICFLLAQFFTSFSDIWVANWIRKEENRLRIPQLNQTQTSTEVFESDTLSTGTYMHIYCGVIAVALVLGIFRSVFFFNVCATVSQQLHKKMFHGIVSTTMRFFDVNPSGRIMNRFSKDMGIIDDNFPQLMLEALQLNSTVLGVVAVTVYTNFRFVVLVLAMFIAFNYFRKLFLKCSIKLKHLEATTKSPIFTHISATLNGISTIRASQTQAILKKEFEQHHDLNTGVWHMLLGIGSGFGMSLDILVYIMISCVIYFFLLVTEDATDDRVGLAVAQLLSLVLNLQFGAEVANYLVSAERILEYCQLEPEKQPEIPLSVSLDWPSQGKIEFRDVFYRYAQHLEPVLRGLSFSVKPNEKVSVVGRTGAGKSSLISSIFRFAEVDGHILIDDIDTSTIDLNVLRSKMSIIPQTPTLFSGTLRKNLDPFDEYSDADVWKALEDVEMKEFVGESNGLSMIVSANGQNFSSGQRQILCLARAILRNNRIIILDEATANVDLRTDEMIQRTIRDKFRNTTVITIAHRLHTVIDYDRVLVMVDGTAVEFDEPYSLMQKDEGVFRQMTQALGVQEYDQLLSMAKKKHFERNEE